MTYDPDFVSQRIATAAAAMTALGEHAETIHRIGITVRDALAAGGMVLTCGNGGSAAEAMHLSEELIGKYRDPRRPWPAVCLNADPTAITCIANDFGYEAVFSRQTEALAKPGDVLVGFSTSGNSPNVKAAFEVARRQGATTIGLLGRDGGACREACDIPLMVPGEATDVIQECHQVVMHLILEAVEADA